MKRMWAGVAALVVAGVLIAGCPSEPNKAPKASMALDKQVLFEGGAVTFNASASKDSDGKVKSFSWIFGDGATLGDSKDRTVAHSYTAAGVYNASLTVKDDKGAKSKPVSATVVVAPNPVAEPVTSRTFENVSFSLDTSSLQGLLSDIEWSFGDGTTAMKGALVEHQFKDNGTYEVTVRITYTGQTATAKLSVTVTNRAPVANISVSSAPPYYCNKAIDFTGAASGDMDGTIVSYYWEFGDGWTENGTSVSHKFVTPGVFTVRLTVRDNDNDTGAVSLNITVEKDLTITNVSALVYKDDNNISRANVTVKFDNRGDAKTAGTINVTVTTYQADKTTMIESKSKSNGGLVDSSSVDNTMSVLEILISNIDPNTTWYYVEIAYEDNVVDTYWYQIV
ncbi:MAG: PKD domain-containing protein [Thermoplasmatota archaeon]